MYDLGPGVPVATNRWALEIITRAFADQVVSSDGPTDADGYDRLSCTCQLKGSLDYVILCLWYKSIHSIIIPRAGESPSGGHQL